MQNRLLKNHILYFLPENKREALFLRERKKKKENKRKSIVVFTKNLMPYYMKYMKLVLCHVIDYFFFTKTSFKIHAVRKSYKLSKKKNEYSI